MKITMPASELKRMLSNALLFASKDDTLPMMTSVRVRWDGEELIFTATDRYRISFERVTEYKVTGKVEGDNDFSIPRRHYGNDTGYTGADQMIKSWPRNLGKDATADLGFDFETLVGYVRVGQSEFLFRAPENNTYLSTRIIARQTAFEAASRPNIAFNLEFLADFGKVRIPGQKRGQTMPVGFEFAERETRPSRVTIGPDFTCMIVPVKGVFE